jgi:hypothetical protein
VVPIIWTRVVRRGKKERGRSHQSSPLPSHDSRYYFFNYFSCRIKTHREKRTMTKPTGRLIIRSGMNAIKNVSKDDIDDMLRSIITRREPQYYRRKKRITYEKNTRRALTNKSPLSPTI